MSWWSGRRGGARLVVSVTGLLLLAGCTGETPEQDPSPSTSPASASPDGTPTAEPVRPEPPQALETPPSIDGAVDVASYFVELYPYVFSSDDDDDDEWRTLSAPECIFCQDVLDDASALAAAGNRREGGAVEVGYAIGTEIGDASSYSVELTMDEAPARIVKDDGTPVEEWGSARSYRTIIVLLHDGARWSVRAVEPTPIEP